jgi:hypothetical protein
VHELHDHLAGRDRLDDLHADRALAHAIDEGAHDVQRRVGFEQCAANLAQRRVDVGLAQRPAAGQPVEDMAQSLRKTVEHQSIHIAKSGIAARSTSPRWGEVGEQLGCEPGEGSGPS